MAEILDPEVEFRSALSVLEGGIHRGIEGMREWAAGLDSIWRDFRLEIIDFRRVGEDRCLLLYRNVGTARGSGIPIDMRTGQIWTWRHGRPWRNVSYTDPHEALRDAGLED
jgi:hypothetical protein